MYFASFKLTRDCVGEYVSATGEGVLATGDVVFATGEGVSTTDIGAGTGANVSGSVCSSVGRYVGLERAMGDGSTVSTRCEKSS